MARVARPYRCSSCGQEYPAALHSDVDDIAVFWTWKPNKSGSTSGWPTSVNGHAYCRNPDCQHFNDYANVRYGRFTAYDGPFFVVGPRCREMRKRFLAMPKPANGARYPSSG